MKVGNWNSNLHFTHFIFVKKNDITNWYNAFTFIWYVFLQMGGAKLYVLVKEVSVHTLYVK